MSYQPHYIASFEDESGLNQYFEPFLIPEKAFPTLENAYAWRGRIQRRLGFDTLGRLRRVIGTSSIGLSGASPWTINTIYSTLVVPIVNEPNAEIQAGSVVVTMGALVFTDNGTGRLELPVIDPLNFGTINYSTGVIVLTHTAGAGVATTISFAYYPGLPVMGLPNNLTNAINEENLRAFDTKYAYQFLGGQFVQLAEVAPANTTWHGTDSDFFWTLSYWPPTQATNKLFWVTNFNNNGVLADPIRYYDTPTTTWTPFDPLINKTQRLQNCRCIVPYKDRLLAFNTWEGLTLVAASNFPQRLRYSQIGDPTIIGTTAPAPTETGSWREDIPGKGGFIDVPSDQAIVSVEFIKDVLVVKLERSSWKVVYTGNKTLPFIFEKINTELGAESTFSLVPFDRGIFSVGNVGILTDDSVNVYRIDQKIPDVVFNIRNDDNGPKRVHGIRDFYKELVYWAFPNSAEGLKFPNKVLVYNYINQTYAIFNDSFTCYGYFQRNSSKTWAEYAATTWNQAIFAWNSGLNQARLLNIVAGNQQGFVLVLNQDTTNSESLSITAITPQALPNPVIITSPNHNLQTGDFVKLTGIIGSGAPNPNTLNGNIYRVILFPTNEINQFTLESLDPVTGAATTVTLAPGGTYLGMGRITYFNNFNITTKVFAPFYEGAGQARVGYLDFLFDKTTDGELTCNFYVDEDNVDSISGNNPLNSGLSGTNTVLTRPENLTLIPYQDQQSKIWHRMFIQSIAQNFQLELKLSDLQMSNEAISTSGLTFHAMVIYLSKNSRLTQ